MDKNFEIKLQWTSETIKQITTQEFIIFTNSPHDAALTYKFIDNNFLKTNKIKASPNFNCFLHTFNAESLEKLIPIWINFKQTYKFNNHAYIKDSYTEELRLKENQNALQQNKP